MSIRIHRWLLLLSLAALWLPIIHLLGAQWSIYEQYSYGWAVPFLCLFFAYRRHASALPAPRSPLPAPSFKPLLLVFLLLLFPLRVLQDANPLWRLASYLLVANAMAITFLMLSIIDAAPRSDLPAPCSALPAGRSLVRRYLFPVLFFFIAVPWPTPVEGFVVQNLTRLNTAAVVEILHAFGVVAMARGNVIEMAAGAVGVEEACSGIRSLQAVLMLSLAFGEWFWLSLRRRIALLAASVATALLLNIIRTVTLSALTAQGGPELAHRWHDTTGIVLLVGCFTLVWFIASRLARNRNPNLNPNPDHTPSSALPAASSDISGFPSAPSSSSNAPPLSVFGFPRLESFSLWMVLLISCLSVIGSELWFRFHESPARETWSVNLPRDAAQFRELPQSDLVQQALQYDSATAGAWQGNEGAHWQFFHFRWNPATSLGGRVRVQLAKSHRPEICLPASGWKLRQEFEPTTIEVQGRPLIFRSYEFSIREQSAFVFFCVREDGTTAVAPGNMRESHGARWKAALAGNRGLGQHVIEVALTGPATRPEAEQLLRSELPRLISIQ